MDTTPARSKARSPQQTGNQSYYREGGDEAQINLQATQEEQRRMMSMSNAVANIGLQNRMVAQNPGQVPGYYDSRLQASQPMYYHPIGQGYQGMSPPGTPPWYSMSIKPGTVGKTKERIRSSTPAIGANASPSLMPPPKSTPGVDPVRLASRTPSRQSSASAAGQLQWKKQCELAAERTSAYANAQKLWERLDSKEPAVLGDPTMGYDEAAIEVAMRGRNHVLGAIEKGARTAGKRWRAVIENTKRTGEPVSSLFLGYETDVRNYRSRAQH